MFASRSLGALPGGGNSLDVPVAALAGLAVAFLAFVAPADLLHGVVDAIGLSAFVPAAEPPLGIKARIGIGAAGAVTVFAIAFLTLRALDRFGSRRDEEAEAPVEREAPRLRRRDFHPDAPARPPLLAAHELGEPELELNQLAAEPPAPRPEEPPLLARKPERQPPPQREPEPFQGERPALVGDEAPTDSEPSAYEPQQDDQAHAYALSQRNWSDYEPEPPVGESAEDNGSAAEPSVPPLQTPDLQEFVPSVAPAPAPETPSREPVTSLWVEDDHSPMPIASEPPREPVDASSWLPEVEPALDPVDEEQAPQPFHPTPEPEPVQAHWAPQPFPPTPESEPVEAEWDHRREQPELEPDHVEPSWTPQPAQPAPEPIEASWPPQPIQAVPESARPVEPEAHEDRPRPPEGSIAELMERLEQGLARHRHLSTRAAPAPSPAAAAAPPPRVHPDPSDDRLQNAIESLQRFASRQD